MASSWDGARDGWRYFATRLDGLGGVEEMIEPELPLTDVTVTDVLSGPPRITASIDPSFLRLLAGEGASRRPVLEEWGVAVYAEAAGQVRAGTLLQGMTPSGPTLDLDLFGFTSYAHGMGYDGPEVCFVDADPLLIVRHAWDHIQGGEDSHLGLELDRATTTDRRVGTPEEDVDFTTGAGVDVSFSAGPYKLNAWETDDLGAEIDTLCRDNSVEYRERHVWADAARSRVAHHLDFGYPRIGARRPDLRFVLGENIQVIPAAPFDGTRYASHVRVLGAGEGRDRVRSDARTRTGRLRRMAFVDAPDADSGAKAASRARLELGRRSSAGAAVSEFLVRDHPMCPLGTFAAGDEVRLQMEADWVGVDSWVRLLTVGISPASPDLMRVTCLRSDWLDA